MTEDLNLRAVNEPGRTIIIMEPGNPRMASAMPYLLAVAVIAGLAIIGVVMLLILRPGAADNPIMVTQIFGFAATTAVGTLAYMRSTETREVVNSRMDEFKRTLQIAADNAARAAHAAGRDEERAYAADQATAKPRKGKG